MKQALGIVLHVVGGILVAAAVLVLCAGISTGMVSQDGTKNFVGGYLFLVLLLGGLGTLCFVRGKRCLRVPPYRLPNQRRETSVPLPARRAVLCSHCGAPNTIQPGKPNQCEYCGYPLPGSKEE